jgi:hypothetical protein
VFDVRGGAIFGAAFEELDRAAAALAAELSIVIFERYLDWFDLPEGLVAAGCADAEAFHFTFVESFTFDCHLRTSIA